jgi:uncharacterized membrane protein YdbT with pleckstrin-like domain
MTQAEPVEEVLYEGRPAVIGGAGSLMVCILTLGIAALFYWIRTLGVHYRITTERIVVELGVLSKRTEQIDLYRITDYVVERPFSQRLLGTGNIVLEAMDRTTPRIVVRGIRTDVMALYEKLRTSTEREKRRRGVRVVDFDEAGMDGGP